ncbi:MAG TPA: hypothetical protein EYN91_14190 [Candidatus Melainabacteria bacterium]|jgi:hypothetical protein|nr:hypothetical protein [Candidatus Melainabacteria bacterium]HIN63283.1 hypothetical protein [Candidatus Obscuribacterales bacterium]
MLKRPIVYSAAILLSILNLPVSAEEQADLAQSATPSLSSVGSANPQEKSGDLPVKYIGNMESRKFHKPSCPYARVMAHSKRMQFHFRRQAVACGHNPCRYCLPPVWTVVKARLLTPVNNDKDPRADPGTHPP